MSQKLCEMFCESIFFETKLYAATKNGQIDFYSFILVRIYRFSRSKTNIFAASRQAWFCYRKSRPKYQEYYFPNFLSFYFLIFFDLDSL